MASVTPPELNAKLQTWPVSVRPEGLTYDEVNELMLLDGRPISIRAAIRLAFAFGIIFLFNDRGHLELSESVCMSGPDDEDNTGTFNHLDIRGKRPLFVRVNRLKTVTPMFDLVHAAVMGDAAISASGHSTHTPPTV